MKRIYIKDLFVISFVMYVEILDSRETTTKSLRMLQDTLKRNFNTSPISFDEVSFFLEQVNNKPI